MPALASGDLCWVPTHCKNWKSRETWSFGSTVVCAHFRVVTHVVSLTLVFEEVENLILLAMPSRLPPTARIIGCLCLPLEVNHFVQLPSDRSPPFLPSRWGRPMCAFVPDLIPPLDNFNPARQHIPAFVNRLLNEIHFLNRIEAEGSCSLVLQ